MTIPPIQVDPSQNSQPSSETIPPADTQTPTPPQPNPDTQSNQVPAWQQLLFEERQARANAENELAKLRAPAPAAPAAPVFEEGELFSNPNKLTNYIQEELRRNTAPLNDWVAEQRRESNYAKLKNTVRLQYPQFTQIEGLVDAAMQGVDPTPANLQLAVQRAVGHIAMTNPQLYLQLIGQAPAQPQPTPQVPTPTPSTAPVIPPSLPPSRPPAAVPQPKSQYKAENFTELEHRLMRENKLTMAQYVALRDTPPDKVHLLDLSQIKD